MFENEKAILRASFDEESQSMRSQHERQLSEVRKNYEAELDHMRELLSQEDAARTPVRTPSPSPSHQISSSLALGERLEGQQPALKSTSSPPEDGSLLLGWSSATTDKAEKVTPAPGSDDGRAEWHTYF